MIATSFTSAGAENFSMALNGTPHDTAAVLRACCCVAVSVEHSSAVISRYCLHCLRCLSVMPFRAREPNHPIPDSVYTPVK